MTGSQSLIARTSLSALIGAASIVICSLRPLYALPRQSFDRMVNVAFVVSRFALYLLVFFILRIPLRGDALGFYWPEANAALAHQVPYRDFYSPYAPFHSYLDAVVISVWHSPLAIVLFAICVEVLILPLWLRVGRIFLTEQEMRLGALLYLTSAISVQFVTINGQNNVIIAVLLAFALLLAYRNRSFASGAAVGLGVAAVKFLPLLYLPGFLAVVPRRWRWLAGATLIMAIAYGTVGFFAHRMILEPLVTEGGLRSADNFPFLFEGVTGLTLPSVLWDMLVLIACALIFLQIFFKSRGLDLGLRLRVLTFGFAALTIALVLLSKKSWPPYLLLCLFPICLLFKSKINIAGFALFGVVTMVSHSYWETVLGEIKAPQFHQGLLSHDPRCLLFLAVEVVLITFYAWILQASIREIHQVPRLASGNLRQEMPDALGS
jgi:hypothetical protein